MSMCVRYARPEDAGAILNIYAPYVKDTAVTFEYDVPEAEAFAERIRNISNVYPYLVCEAEGGVVAYAYASKHMERAAYGWDVQTSIYAAPGVQGQGLGRRLYGVLLALLRVQGCRNAYAVITVPNAQSVEFHAALGFSMIGVFRRTGYKLGRWHDVAWMEQGLGSYDTPPAPLKSMDEVRALHPDVQDFFDSASARRLV